MKPEEAATGEAPLAAAPAAAASSAAHFEPNVPSAPRTTEAMTEKLANEKERLSAAKAQFASVQARMEEIQAELSHHLQHGQLSMYGEITAEDVENLKQAFKDDITDVFVDLRPSTHWEGPDVPELVDDQLAEDEEPADAVAEQDLGSRRNTHVSVLFQPVDADLVRTTFRIHDVYTFADLRDDMCRYLGMLHRAEEMELFNSTLNVAWPAGDMVLAQSKKGALDNDSCMLRLVPEGVRLAVVADAEMKAEAELQQEILAKADAARRRGNSLRAIASERKRERHARSLLLRGSFHGIYCCMLAVAIVGDVENAGYWTGTHARGPRARRVLPMPTPSHQPLAHIACLSWQVSPSGNSSWSATSPLWKAMEAQLPILAAPSWPAHGLWAAIGAPPIAPMSPRAMACFRPMPAIT